MGNMSIESIELARLMLDFISDVKGEDIVIIDLREVTPIADYFVICSAASDRQLKAILEKVVDGVREQTRVKPLHREGQAESGWVLLDYGEVVLHAFTPEQRSYYDLESFWREGKTIVRMQ